MVFNTITVGSAVTPTVIETYFSHYLNRKPLHQKPTAHISYHEGLRLVRAFLLHASHHTVEEIQAFTSQWVPSPRWVRNDEISIPSSDLDRAAIHIQSQLGPRGVEVLGGKTWWQWRLDDVPLKAEWIEMRSHYTERKRKGGKSERIMLYIHGGAYFFGSVDEHRYQMQRHARKLRARVLAPRYRLAPEFPFPCGLHDCLAAYLYLLQEHDPNTIVLAGDSAGGGMVLGLLVTIRDQGIPAPAGAILLSPWVDLTHSFPSVAGDGKLDYIPNHGFHHRPSLCWPPPNDEQMRAIRAGKPIPDADEISTTAEHRIAGQKLEESDAANTVDPNDPVLPNLSITLDGKLVRLKDQIQLYTTNQMLTHPLVSPVLQPSLGGLPPLLIQVGGGELLRDEQVYLAHKAANPLEYPPPVDPLKPFGYTEDGVAAEVQRWKGTDVQLQVWDDLCHVAHTLSWTRPAKYMYRGVAQFGAWALARAGRREVEILDDDEVSQISTSSSSTSSSSLDLASSSSSDLKASAHDGPNGSTTPTIDQRKYDSKGKRRASAKKTKNKAAPSDGRHAIATQTPRNSIPVLHAPLSRTDSAAVGRAGDPLPPFTAHMIRQRVDRHGVIHALPPAEELAGCQVPRESVGAIQEGPVRRWLAMRSAWERKFGRAAREVRRRREELRQVARVDGTDERESRPVAEGERPPPTAIVGWEWRVREARRMGKGRGKRSWGMSLWSLWGSSHDEATIEREERKERGGVAGGKEMRGRRRAESKGKEGKEGVEEQARPGLEEVGRNRSHHSAVTDLGQTSTEDQKADGKSEGGGSAEKLVQHGEVEPTGQEEQPTTPSSNTEGAQVGSDTGGLTFLSPYSSRPAIGGVAMPFKLASPPPAGVNASTLTLASVEHGVPPVKEVKKEEDGSAVATPENDMKEEKTVIGEGSVVESEEASASRKRPEPQTFITAWEGQELRGE
ncbi:alpha/beta-hydrolase [Viridothelium virens]|uniref:Alpha/beta-hydrolase n=1 Tax=Viridothelium virens TaxID=1048519 RepID=A0A6A6HNH9_VIRVR|nr:alpha/beta-hydrolase [Viridothelium virens]